MMAWLVGGGINTEHRAHVTKKGQGLGSLYMQLVTGKESV